jgi:hypothetical protein
MTTMAPPRATELPARATELPARATELPARRVRLITGPAAVAQARGQVRAAIRAWRAPVDSDVAILLTSDLVTDAARHETGEMITLAVRCGRGRLRVDVHGTSRAWPVTDGPDGAGIGPGLTLVARLAAEWGFYRTPTGTVVYFTLPFQPDLAEGGGHG